MKHKFNRTTWTQQGLKISIKDIPGETRFGVIAQEEIDYQNSEVALVKRNAMMSKDVEAIRKNSDYPSKDITQAAVHEEEILIDNEGTKVPVTVYNRVKDSGQPVIIYFHGGGWVYCTRKSVEDVCKLLALRSGAVVFNVEYRLAPEFKYPAGVNDCFAVVRYVHDHAEELGIDSRNISVAGDSAGGNIAAICSLRDGQQGSGMIRSQILVYPAVTLSDPTLSLSTEEILEMYDFDDAHHDLAVALILGLKHSWPFLASLYLNDRAEGLLEDVSPLQTEDFSVFPKTLIICAQYDFLTPQGKSFGHRLARAGVDTQFVMYRGTAHGFFVRTGDFPQAEDSVEVIADFIAGL